MKVREKTEAMKSRRAITQEASNRPIMPRLQGRRRAPLPSRARRFRRRWRRRRRGGRNARSTIPRCRLPPSISALSNGLDAALGLLELPNAAGFRAPSPASALRQAPVGVARLQPHLRPQPVPRLRDQTLEADQAACDDRDPLAQPFGMMDDMGREDHGRARRRFVADQAFEPALVDRVEPGKGLVEHDQLRLVDDGAEQLDGLCHALGEALDRLVDIVGQAVLPEQDLASFAPNLERQAAQRAHEGDRFLGRHCRIKAALLGQIADDPGRLERPFMAEQGAGATIRLDDAEQHAQSGGLAGAVRAENAVNAPLRHRDVDAAHCLFSVEGFDEAFRLDR